MDDARLVTLTNKFNKSTSLAVHLFASGLAAQALPLLELTLDGQRKVLGERHPDTLGNLSNLAACLDALGRTTDALQIYEQALAGQREVLGERHPDTLNTLSLLACCLDAAGRASEALPLYRLTFDEQREVLGEQHPETLENLINLAACLVSLDRLRDALPLLEQVLARQREGPGEQHPETLSSLRNLAGCLIGLGRTAEALPLLEKALATGCEVLGIQHPDTLNSLGDLAFCLDTLGRTAESLPLLEQALASQLEIVGEEHPDTIRSLNNLAASLKSLNHADLALPGFQLALTKSQKVFGKCHPNTLTCLNNLGWCFEALGCTDKVIPLYKQALAGLCDTLGKQHLRTLICLDNLAACLHNLGHTNEALPLFEQSLDGFHEVLGEQHPETLTAMNNLSFALESLGRKGEALSRRRQLIKAMQSSPQPGGKWLEILSYCTIELDSYAKSGQLTDWADLFHDLARPLREVLDLEAAEQLAVSREQVTAFHATYLRLCIDLERPDLVPAALAAVQGRKLAALVLDELEAQHPSTTADTGGTDLRTRFQTLRVELRQLSLGLQTKTDRLIGDNAPLDAEVAAQLQRERLDTYGKRLAEYQQLRAELEANDPDFAITAPALSPSLEELQAGLATDEALALLIHRHDQDSDQALALLIRPSQVQLIPLDSALLGTAALVRPCGDALGREAGSKGPGWRRADPDAPAPSDTATIANDPMFADRLRTRLWEPLAPALSGVRHLHLVTHGELHLLPYEQGMPTQLDLTTYPGLVYYHLLRHQRPTTINLDRPGGQLAVAVHGAEHTDYPIPMVHVETQLLEAQWPGPVTRYEPDVITGGPLTCLHLSAHGDHDEQDPTLAGLLLSGERHLAFYDVLRQAQGPALAFLSACLVGRTSEDPDGDPLGLMGAFFLRGTRYLIASIQPVNDFYMPLLVCLFHQAWQEERLGPQVALAEAKRRLATGDWYSDTETLVREAYHPALDHWLAHLASERQDHALAALTWQWPLADPDHRHLDPHRGQRQLAKLRQALTETSTRHQIVDGILDRLVAERAQLPVDDLCTWVRGFGTATPPSDSP